MSGSDPPIGRPDRARPPRIANALPLPQFSLSLGRSSAYFTVSAIDARGRIADASPLRQLHWGPGLPISLTTAAGAVTAAVNPSGSDAITKQGHLRLPARVRHALRLEAGDRVLAVAFIDRDLLIAYTMPALDAMVSNYERFLDPGRPA